MRSSAQEALDLAERQFNHAKKFAGGATREELLKVGRTTEEILITLAQGLYTPEEHEPRTGPKPGASPARRLEAYVDSALAGPTNGAPRSLAKSQLQTLESLQQMGTTDVKTAAWCLEAAASLLRLLRIAAGPSDLDYKVKDLIDRFIKSRDLGESHLRSLQAMSGMEIGQKVAAKLTVDDLIEHCRIRRERIKAATGKKGVSGATVRQDVAYLRSVFNTARTVWNIPLSMDAFDQARHWLERLELVAKHVPRTRRVTNDEIDLLLKVSEERAQHAKTTILVGDLMLFALHSGWQLGEICSLKWSELKDERHRLIDQALDVIERQRAKGNSDRIFPYNAHSASQAFRDITKAAGIKGLRFQDFRKEAAIRLFYEHGKTMDEISRMIGRTDLNSLRRDIEQAATDYARNTSNTGVTTTTSKVRGSQQIREVLPKL